QRDGLSNAVDREIPRDLVFAITILRDLSGNKGDLGELFDVEEVRALQVGVALRVAGLNGSGRDLRLDLAIGGVLRIEGQTAGYAREFAAGVGDPQVPGLEIGRRGGGVNRVWDHVWSFLRRRFQQLFVTQ